MRYGITNARLNEVLRERVRQDAKWGEQNHPNGTGPNDAAAGLLICCGMMGRSPLDYARQACDIAAHHDTITYAHILFEEVCEAFDEQDEAKLRAELIQVAAVAVAWVEAIDRRKLKVEACDGSM